MPLTVELLNKYKAKHTVFVETGTHRGDGVAAALEAGFVRAYSCDNAEFAYGWASCRFQHQNHRVHLALMDSPSFIRWLFENVSNQSFLFFLDAHWCGGNGELDGADRHLERPAPLLAELEVIAEMGGAHTILIDDVRMFGHDVFPTQTQILEALEKVNPDYHLRYEDCDFPGDVLVAIP
jgi:hypothetical protein